MPAELLKGAPIAARLRASLAEIVRASGTSPCLLSVVVGDLGPSRAYLDSLDKAAATVGIVTRRLALPEDISPSALGEAVEQAAADPSVHGLLLQLPLPSGLDETLVTTRIPPAKDVDGLTLESLGRVLAGRRSHTSPATAAAVVEILRSDPRLDPAGRQVAIVGRSLVVGRPLAAMLADRGSSGNATVTLCHTRTRDLGAILRRADIVVAAAGARHLVTADMVAPGAVVVDVGTHLVPLPDGRSTLTGDVHPGVAEVAGFLTPVPGGVGPVTTAVLLRHVVAAADLGRLEPAW